MKKIVLTVFALGFAFSLNARTCFSQQTPAENSKDLTKASERNSQENIKITDEIKARIIKSVLEQTHLIKERTLPEWALEKLIIKISEKNIDSKLLPKFPRVEFILLTDDEIKNSVSVEYLEFEYFRAEKYKITAYFSTIQAGKGFFPSKHKTTYECREDNAKWVCAAVAHSTVN